MLGYVSPTGAGEADRLLADVAARLAAQGWPLAGAVQVNSHRPGARCDMDLHVLAGHEVIRISQDLGRQAAGCRLDPGGLERAAGLAEAALEGAPDGKPRLVIVNKFGKQEAEGRGFRPLIGQALAAGVPVLTAVGRGNRDAFLAFAGGLARELPGDADALIAWAAAARAAA